MTVYLKYLAKRFSNTFGMSPYFKKRKLPTIGQQPLIQADFHSSGFYWMRENKYLKN